MIKRNESPRDLLSFVETYYEDGLYDRASKMLERARELFPEDLTFIEWEAVFAGDESRFHDALDLLERVLRIEPRRTFALREKGAVLMQLGRFGEALDILLEVGPEQASDAAYYFDLAQCHDRVGEATHADATFQQAAGIDPQGFLAPPRLSDEEFAALVERALDAVNEECQPYLDGVRIRLQDFPEFPEENPYVLVRLYRAPAARGEGRSVGGAERDELVVFKRNFEIDFPEADALSVEITRAVIQEVMAAHGLEDE